jgi:SAM-dependent methyltransferase
MVSLYRAHSYLNDPTFSQRDRPMHYPKPIFPNNPITVSRMANPRDAAERLIAGEQLLVSDHYSTGAEILSQLHTCMNPPPSNAPFQSRQRFRHAFRQAALHLLAPIRAHELALEGARPIGFLQEFYPTHQQFVLPFLQVQEMHGAWMRYDEGQHMAVLGQRIHPYYGTYIPTRTCHLELFATWLSQYSGERSVAVDVGAGCGVLALMLNKAGFQNVTATDINPNAVESVSREITKRASAANISSVLCDLLEEAPQKADLIVFNPPWIQSPVEDMFDRALFYEEGLLERFFTQAHTRLNPGGRVVILFSNIIQLIQPELDHPVEQEVTRGRLNLIAKHERRVKATPNAKGETRRTKERVQLWEFAAVD